MILKHDLDNIYLCCDVLEGIGREEEKEKAVKGREKKVSSESCIEREPALNQAISFRYFIELFTGVKVVHFGHIVINALKENVQTFIQLFHSTFFINPSPSLGSISPITVPSNLQAFTTFLNREGKENGSDRSFRGVRCSRLEIG